MIDVFELIFELLTFENKGVRVLGECFLEVKNPAVCAKFPVGLRFLFFPMENIF